VDWSVWALIVVAVVMIGGGVRRFRTERPVRPVKPDRSAINSARKRDEGRGNEAGWMI
jgi:hypothetical protein